MNVRLRLSTYLHLVLAAGALWILVQDLRIGAAYTVAALGTALPLVLIRVPYRHYYLLLFVGVAVWLTHLLRPLMLVVAPDVFSFSRVGVANRGIIAMALFRIGIYSGLLLGGLALGLRFFTSERDREEPWHHDAGDAPLLVQGQVLLVIAGVLFLALRAYLQLNLGLFTKLAEPDPQLGFLTRLIPETLIYGVGALLLIRHRENLSLGVLALTCLVLLGFVGLALLSGTKAFLAHLGLVVFVVALAERGDFRMPFLRALAVGVMAGWLLLLSFSIARTLRFERPTARYSIQMAQRVAGAAATAAIPDREAFLSLSDMVTARFNGFDGMVVTEIHRPAHLRQVFAPLPTLGRAVQRVIPHYRPRAPTLSSGKAVAVAYSGHDLEKRHAGAVGLFAALRLMSSDWGVLIILPAFGLFWAIYFRITERMPGRDAVVLLHTIGTFHLLRWTMSGNLDFGLATYVIDLGHFAVYGGVLAVCSRLIARRVVGSEGVAPGSVGISVQGGRF